MMLGAEKRGTKNLMATRWNVGLRQKKWLKLKTIGPYLAVSSNIETVTIWHTKNRHLKFFFVYRRGMHSKFQQRFEDKYLKKHV